MLGNLFRYFFSPAKTLGSDKGLALWGTNIDVQKAMILYDDEVTLGFILIVKDEQKLCVIKYSLFVVPLLYSNQKVYKNSSIVFSQYSYLYSRFE